MSDSIADAIAERDRILVAMDIDAAKVFIAKHGGYVASARLDWIKILHLARFEVTTIAKELVIESQIYLARNGAQAAYMLPSSSPYLKSAMDLIFPKRLTDSFIASLEANQS